MPYIKNNKTFRNDKNDILCKDDKKTLNIFEASYSSLPSTVSSSPKNTSSNELNSTLSRNIKSKLSENINNNLSENINNILSENINNSLSENINNILSENINNNLTENINNNLTENINNNLLESVNNNLTENINNNLSENINKNLIENENNSLDKTTIIPSKVLLFSNLVAGITEIDVCQLIKPFLGDEKVKVFAHPTSGYAFVEFSTVDVAKNALEYMTSHPIVLNNSVVDVCFSRRNNVLLASEQLDNYRTILLSVCNMTIPVDLTVFYKICSKYGNVEKIVTFGKSLSVRQAIVQFDKCESAKLALNSLHNQNIYHGCNTLQVLPSKRKELEICENSRRSWDYTKDPNGPMLNQNNNENVENNINNGIDKKKKNVMNDLNVSIKNNGIGFNITSSLQANPTFSSILICFNLPEKLTCENVFNLFSLYGSVSKVKLLYQIKCAALIQYTDPLFATLAVLYLHHSLVKGKNLEIFYSRIADIRLKKNDENKVSDDRTMSFPYTLQRYKVNSVEKFVRTLCHPQKTIFVSGISNINLRDILNLFKKFGRIVKYEKKFLPLRVTNNNRKEYWCLFIEYENVSDALYAIMLAHNYNYNNCIIKVSFTKTVLNSNK